MHYKSIHRCWNLLFNARGATTLIGQRPHTHATISIRGHEHFLLRELSSTPHVQTTLPISASATATLKFKDRSISEIVTDTKDKVTSDVSVKVVTTTKGSRTTEAVIEEEEEEEQGSPSTRTIPAVLELQIQQCNSPEELLKMSTIQTLLLKHACMILHRLGQLSETDVSIKLDSLHEDDRFIRMCNLVQGADYSYNPHLLFAALQGLEKLGALESSEIYQTLNIEWKWGMRRCQIRYLIRAIALFAPSQDKKLIEESKDCKMDIVELAIHTLQRRWVEIVSGSDFNAVFKILQFLDEETRGKLEDRAVEMVSTFTPSEMRQIFITLAIQRRRPTPLLRTLAYHFAKSMDSSNAKDLIELTYALNELTFADPVLMEKILNNLCPDIPTIENPALISSLVTSLGQMRYKHKAIMRILDEWIVHHNAKLRPFDCAAWLLTCAVLNHYTENTKEFCQHFKSAGTTKISSGHVEWINIVHSLLVLNSHSDELLASVLTPEVITSIENMGAVSYKSKIKLLNINYAAKSLTNTGYKGPLLNQKVESQWAASVLNTSDKKLAAIALDTMSSFLPPDKYLTLNQKLRSGVFVDAVCMLNKNMEPVSHTEVKKSKTPCQPAAIVIEGYSSMTLGNKEPTGQTILNQTLLKKEGYKVLSIPYTEFSSSEKLIRRAKYLEQKLKSIGDAITV